MVWLHPKLDWSCLDYKLTSRTAKTTYLYSAGYQTQDFISRATISSPIHLICESLGTCGLDRRSGSLRLRLEGYLDFRFSSSSLHPVPPRCGHAAQWASATVPSPPWWTVDAWLSVLPPQSHFRQALRHSDGKMNYTALGTSWWAF